MVRADEAKMSTADPVYGRTGFISILKAGLS